MTVVALLCWALLLLGGQAHAQTQDPWGSWRTVTTEHYRLHYPVEAEPWALLAAGQLDEIRERVVAEVGWAPEQIVDIVVMDPFRASNGFAIPLLRSPRMGLFATPPGASPYFGHYRSWAEELLVHEDAHLVHLMRPSRNPLIRALDATLVGFAPVTLKSPAWVIEGYATVVEGRLTEMGRPNADFRASLLRTWAQDGLLPTYDQLDGSPRWMGGSARYLVGSAYLEWLEARTGPGSLRALWARMTARKVRSFDEAFEGVFEGTPAELYARFSAEVTHAALTIEDARPADQDTRWLDSSWTTGAPALSPDGSSLAVVLRHKKRPSRLTVFPTEADPAAATEWEEEVAETLAADPEDVAPARPRFFPPKPTKERVRTSYSPSQPRWSADGATLYFVSWLRDGDGWGRPDAFSWDPEAGAERRITRGADITAIEPHPDGTWAVGARTFWGSQHLVRVDLETGEWSDITAPDPAVVVDVPRFHPDGDRFLYLEHRAGWHLMVRDVETGAEAEIALPEGAAVSAPAWSADGKEIWATLGLGGFFEVYALSLDGEAPRQITHSPGGAHGVAPTPDGAALYYLSLDDDGAEIHRLAVADAQPPLDQALVSTLPVVRPTPPAPIPPPEVVAVTAEPYGLGRQELRALVGGTATPHAGSVEVGLRLGDAVGRSDLLLIAALSPANPGMDGGALAWAWRGLPVTLTLHGFGFREDAAETVERAGGALLFDTTRGWNQGGVTLLGGAWLDVPLGTDDIGFRAVGFAGLGLNHRLRHRMSWLQPTLSGRVQLGQTQDDGAWTRHEESVELRFGLVNTSLGVRAGIGRTTATGLADQFRLGGASSSVVPDPWLWSRVLVPGLAPGIARGEATDSLHGDVDFGGFGLFVERHRAGDACELVGVCDDGASSLAGASLRLSTPPVPLGKAPAVDVDFGVACVFETPIGGLVDRACRQPADWASWVGVTYRP